MKVKPDNEIENIDENNNFMKFAKEHFSMERILKLMKEYEENNAKVYCVSKLIYRFDKNDTPVDSESNNIKD